MRVRLGLVSLGLLLAIAPATWADDPIGRISFGGSAGFSSYTLESVNDRLNDHGNPWLEEQDWSTLDQLKHGWTFWGEVKFPLPLGMLGLYEVAGIPLELYATGGYLFSSGTTGGKDYNELIEVIAEQESFNFRLLYALPWRFHDDIRLFVGGGPIVIKEQTVTARHTSRVVNTGQAQETQERIEEVIYTGSGSGIQLGLAAEYLVQDHITLSLDLGYRWAAVDFDPWSASTGLTISDTNPADFGDGTFSDDRLQRDASFVFHSFLDREGTEAAEIGTTGSLHEYGPHIDQVRGLESSDLDLDLSGLQVQLGFRFYFF